MWMGWIWQGLLIGCGLLLFGWGRGGRNSLDRFAGKTFAGSGSSTGMEVSVIVPARDEEANLKELLPLLEPAPKEIIVVDDGSSDGTRQSAVSRGVALVEAGPLPPGWQGKAWACAQGAEAATGSRLLFLDADVRPAPDLLRLLTEAAGEGGCVTVQPYHRIGSPAEQLSAFFNAAVLAGSGRFSLIARRGREGSFGPCLFCSREDYRMAGGHAAVRGEVLENDRLAARFRSAGMPCRAYAGGSRLSFRMYDGGLKVIAAGWAKSIALGAASAQMRMLALTILWISGLSGAAIGAVSAAAKAVSGQPQAAELAVFLVLYAFAAWTCRRAFRLAGSFGAWTHALYPLGLAYFCGVFAYGLYRSYIRRRVSWKGRDIDVA